jgi:transcriptional regulator with XRE-family HTH domain
MKFNRSKEWLDQMLELETSCESFMVGGPSADQVARLTSSTPENPHTRSALAVLVELARRKKGLNIVDFANKVGIALEHAMDLEKGQSMPLPRTVHKVADYLGLPKPKLMVMAGLTKPRDISEINQQAIKFAASSKPVELLSKEELKAFEDFVSYLNAST